MSLIKFTFALTAAALLTAPVMAQTQDISHETPHDMSKMEPETPNHAKMDHSKMDHTTHDMSQMEGEVNEHPITAGSPVITAKVNGLVCDFCAQALKKVFKKEAAVERINVDLDAGEVQILLKTGGEIEDARVKKLIRKSGYSLVGLERSGGA